MRSYSEKTRQRIRGSLGKSQKPQRQLQRSNVRVALAERGKTGKVVILGAGAAGLCSAYELGKIGYDVTILEAQENHLGGRIRTYRDGESYCEFGAMRIPEHHDLTLGYIKEFGLQTRKFVQNNPQAFAHIRGAKVNRTEGGYESLKPRFPLNEHEQSLSVDDLWLQSVVATLESFTPEQELELFGNSLNSVELKSLDQESLYNHLRKAGYTRAAIEYLSSVYGVTTYLNTGLSEHLREEFEGVWLGEFFEVNGGMDRLVQSFRDAISARLVTGAVVTAIVNDETTPEVSFIHNGNAQTIAADWVICTIPLGVLSRLDISRAFSHDKIDAIRNVHYDSSSKIISRTSDRFWELEDEIYGGGSIWDGGLGHTWYPADNAETRDTEKSNQKSLLLSSYTWGMHARRIDAIPQNQLEDYVIRELSKLHPSASKENAIEYSKRWSWDNHRWSAGAFAFFNPGDHTDLHQQLVTPENRVLLAGEHCSLTHSWIQGALESALHVCQHITTN